MPRKRDGEKKGGDTQPRDVLVENEARFRALTENVSDITAILDENGFITYCSPSINSLGYSVDEILGKRPLDLVHPTDIAEVEQALMQAAMNPFEPVIVHEVRVRTKKAEWMSFEGALTSMPDQPGINGIVFKGYDISRRKIVESALVESKQKLKSILASISDMVFGLDPNGIIIDFHIPADHPEFFMPPDTLLSKSYKDVLPPYVAQLLDTAIENAVSTGNVQKVVYPLEINEEIFWFETKVSTRHNHNGKSNGVTVVSRDITDPKRVEEELQKSHEQLEQRVEERTRELQESESKFRELFNNMKSGVAFYKARDNGNDFIFTDFNRAAERIENLKKEDVVGKSVLKFFPGIKEFGLFDIFQRVWKTGKPEFHPTTLYKDDRIQGWRENYICKLPTGEVVAIYTDVTERCEAQEALKKSEERLAAFMDSATEAFFLLDSQLIFTNVNVRGLEILGKKWGQVVGKKLRRIIPDAKNSGKYNRILDVLKTGNPFTIDDYTFSSALGELKGILKCFKVGDGLGVMFIDTTESKRLEEQLRHAQKMKAIGTLAGGIAHDFNNILGIIVGFTELAADGLPDDSLEKSNLHQVLAAADRAKELVAQILAFSRKGEKERKPILLKDIVTETTKLLRSILPTTIEIHSHIQEPLGYVQANPTQIHQVVMNICTNAAHSMREKGGILEITLKEVELDPDPQHPEKPGLVRYQMLTFSDTGHGMPANILEHIFNPYYTTKKTGEGSGMGLAVVHGIVKSHKGDISVYSEQGKGTTFHVSLPVTSKKGGREENKQGPIRGGDERVLFVDDEPHLTKMGEKLLNKLGYRVTISTSSIDALEIFRQRPHEFDIVISDQTMPRMTGLQMTAEIRKIKPGFPVILCTGFSETINEENFRSHGIDGFIMKPLLLRDFAHIIRSVLDGKKEK